MSSIKDIDEGYIAFFALEIIMVICYISGILGGIITYDTLHWLDHLLFICSTQAIILGVPIVIYLSCFLSYKFNK